MGKSNRKHAGISRLIVGRSLPFIFLLMLMTGLLVYTRFVHFDWGLPYPMHPDERNMANALQQLHCGISFFNFRLSTVTECLNPHFFAYGQLPLYLGYFGIQAFHFITGTTGTPINFSEAVMALRIISAIASVVTAFVLLAIIRTVLPNRKNQKSLFFYSPVSFILIIFSPFFIQFAHFGTTESLLMLAYSLLVYGCLAYPEGNRTGQIRMGIFLGFVSGAAIAVKVSSFLFLLLPLGVIITKNLRELMRGYRVRKGSSGSLRMGISGIQNRFWQISLFFLAAAGFSVLMSPHNILNPDSFMSSLQYESGVALGTIRVFYTRQFAFTIPILFQIVRIFPYALGLPVFILAVVGFFGLSWKSEKINMLRYALILYFLPGSFLFAKWTRFMAPAFPLMLIFALLFLCTLHDRLYGYVPRFVSGFVLCAGIVILVVPGAAYLSIYQNSDVRFQASQWIYRHIPPESIILSETANSVDLPLPTVSGMPELKGYRVIPFDFYHLDENAALQNDLSQSLAMADYIMVPSRRIWANMTCVSDPDKGTVSSYFAGYDTDRCRMLDSLYPLLNSYYGRLFSGELGFRKVAEFSSYPRINMEFSIFNFHVSFPDEYAEETWSVFDHPVIRIYQKLRK